MVQFTITVIGLPEQISRLNRSSSTLATELKKSLGLIGDRGVKEFQNEAHVLTGKMKRGIKKGKVTNNTVDIVSKEKYAVFENRRGGAHAFIDKGQKKLEKIAKQEIDTAIKRIMTIK